MATHVAIAFVVDEDDAKVGTRRGGRQQVGAVHIGMAARLVHQELAQVVTVGFEPGTLFQNAGAGHGRQAGSQDAQRLAASVRVHGLDGTDKVQHGGSKGKRTMVSF